MDLKIRIASYVIAALGFSAVIAIGKGGAADASDIWPDASRLLLKALLLPALEFEAMPPLHWVDPRPALGCGADSEVRVNGAPLVAGARVPDPPFTLEWQSDGCHPFGQGGPRFDGRVQLTVARESSGLSVAVEPSDLRVAWEKNAGALHEQLCIDRSEPDEPDVAVPCR